MIALLLMPLLLVPACHPGGPRGIAGDRPASLERAIWEEVNLARKEPGSYATHLDHWLPRFEGRRLHRPGRTPVTTEEGPSAVEEAIAFLRQTAPRPSLSYSAGLEEGARDLVDDLGPLGGMGHVGSDGSRVGERVGRYGTWKRKVGEAIQYGSADPREIVALLIIDDGVPDRGHRRILFDPDFRLMGVACGPHARHEIFCVLTFAGQYVEGPAPGRSLR